MSVVCGTLARMNVGEVLAELSVRGVRVEDRLLPGTLAAGYSHRERTVFVQPDLPERWLLPTLMHELEHVRAGHHGHQDAVTEARINQAVARALISPTEYALAEQITGGHTGAIALELDLPRWVVSAYRRQLWRQGGFHEKAG